MLSFSLDHRQKAIRVKKLFLYPVDAEVDSGKKINVLEAKYGIFFSNL